MDQLLAKLAEQQSLLKRQQHALISTEDDTSISKEQDSSSDGSVPFTPATESFDLGPTRDGDKVESDHSQPDAKELQRLKDELQAANSKIARMDQELSQTRITKHTLDQALGPPSEMDFQVKDDITEQTISSLQNALNASTRPQVGPSQSRPAPDDSRSDTSDALSAGGYNRAQAIWANTSRPVLNLNVPTPLDQHFHDSGRGWDQDSARPWCGNRGNGAGSSPVFPTSQRPLPGPSMQGLSDGGRFMGDFTQFPPHQTGRPPQSQNDRLGASFAARNPQWGGYRLHTNSVESMSSASSSYLPSPMYQAPMSYQPRPIGTPLSPTAAEFTANHALNNPWNASVSPCALKVDSTVAHPVRHRLRRAKPMYLPSNLSITAVYLTAPSIATGNTLSTRLSATMINRRPSSCNRS